MQVRCFLVSKNIKANRYTSRSPDPLVNAQLYDIPERGYPLLDILNSSCYEFK